MDPYPYYGTRRISYRYEHTYDDDHHSDVPRETPRGSPQPVIYDARDGGIEEERQQDAGPQPDPPTRQKVARCQRCQRRASECGCNSRSTRIEPAYRSTPRTRSEVYYDTGGSSPRGTLPLNLDSDREPSYRPSRSHGHRSRSPQQTYEDSLPRSTDRHDDSPDDSRRYRGHVPRTTYQTSQSEPTSYLLPLTEGHQDDTYEASGSRGYGSRSQPACESSVPGDDDDLVYSDDDVSSDKTGHTKYSYPYKSPPTARARYASALNPKQINDRAEDPDDGPSRRNTFQSVSTDSGYGSESPKLRRKHYQDEGRVIVSAPKYIVPQRDGRDCGDDQSGTTTSASSQIPTSGYDDSSPYGVSRMYDDGVRPHNQRGLVSRSGRHCRDTGPDAELRRSKKIIGDGFTAEEFDEDQEIRHEKGRRGYGDEVRYRTSPVASYGGGSGRGGGTVYRYDDGEDGYD